MHHKEVQRASWTVYNTNCLDLDDIDMEKGADTTVADVNSCSSNTKEVLDKVLDVLGDMSEVTELLLVSNSKELTES